MRSRSILLIVLAFLVARSVVKCGLGQCIGYAVVSLFGRSPLGPSYSVFLVDAVIAPAFPSNTARASVLFPLASSLGEAAGAKPDDPSRRKTRGFLMYSSLRFTSGSPCLGQNLATAVDGISPVATGLILVVAYVLLHHLFVSQTAHLLALFGVFLDVGVRLDVPAVVLAFLLLFATNFFSGITPQGSSANLLFAGSGFMTQAELSRIGAISTTFSLLVYFVIGVPWLMLVARWV